MNSDYDSVQQYNEEYLRIKKNLTNSSNQNNQDLKDYLQNQSLSKNQYETQNFSTLNPTQS